MKRKIVVAIGGASGSILAKLLLDKLVVLQSNNDIEVNIVHSTNALINWQLECQNSKLSDYPFKTFANNDFNAPFASGSAQFDTMIMCPTSMGQMGRIASGISNDLISRAADVILKERRKLIMIPRETPFSLIHINNMKTLTEAGAIICPAIPSFYSQPDSIEEMLMTIVDRALGLAGFETNSFRWGE